MDFSLINIEKQVIKKTKLSFCFIKNFLGTPSKKPIRRDPEGPGVHLVVVCMGLHESAVFRRAPFFPFVLYQVLPGPLFYLFTLFTFSKDLLMVRFFIFLYSIRFYLVRFFMKRKVKKRTISKDKMAAKFEIC